MTFLLTLWKWLRNIPVLFAHFPGPTLLLVALAMGFASLTSAWLTHHFEAAARAGLRADLAEARQHYADERAAAANGRADTIKSAADEQAAINVQTVAFMQEAMRAFIDAKNVAAPALAVLGQKIEELHNDAKFACRREPLPSFYLDGLHVPAWRVPAAATGEAGGHQGQRAAGDAMPARDP